MKSANSISLFAVLVGWLALSTHAYAEVSCMSRCDTPASNMKADCESIGEQYERDKCVRAAADWGSKCYSDCTKSKKITDPAMPEVIQAPRAKSPPY